MNFQTSIAFHKPTQTIKSVYDVPSGAKCECICEDCNGEIESVRRQVPQKSWYFRHLNKSNCNGSFESLLHRYAKQIIVENHSIVGLDEETIIYKSAVSESSLNTYRPDIILTHENSENIYIEIFVTHAVKEIKKDFFVQNKYKSFEIDLSELCESKNLVTPEEIKEIVLNESENRKALYWNEPIELIKSNKRLIVEWIICGLIVIGSILFFLNKKSNKSKPNTKFLRRKYK